MTDATFPNFSYSVHDGTFYVMLRAVRGTFFDRDERVDKAKYVRSLALMLFLIYI
jgi:hypothetical protein